MGTIELIDMLMEMGLTAYESKVYLSLLMRNSSGVAEISIHSGVPRSQVYGTLKNLMVKGFCSVKQGKIQNYCATAPEVALNTYREYLKEIEIKKDERIGNLISKLIGALTLQFEKGWKERAPLEYIEVLKSKRQIAEKIFELEREAKDEILAFSKPPYAMAFIENKEEFDAIARGVKNKAIYEYDGTNREDFLKFVEFYVSAGEEARIVAELPIKVIVFDEKKVITLMQNPTSTSQSSLTSIVIEHPDSVKAFKKLFEYIWEDAVPFEQFKANTILHEDRAKVVRNE